MICNFSVLSISFSLPLFRLLETNHSRWFECKMWWIRHRARERERAGGVHAMCLDSSILSSTEMKMLCVINGYLSWPNKANIDSWLVCLCVCMFANDIILNDDPLLAYTAHTLVLKTVCHLSNFPCYPLVPPITVAAWCHRNEKHEHAVTFGNAYENPFD